MSRIFIKSYTLTAWPGVYAANVISEDPIYLYTVVVSFFSYFWTESGNLLTLPNVNYIAGTFRSASARTEKLADRDGASS